MSDVNFGESLTLICGCTLVPCGDCDEIVRCRVVASCEEHKLKPNTIISKARSEVNDAKG